MLTRKTKRKSLISLTLGLISLITQNPAFANLPRNPDNTETCEILIVGGGLAGAAAAYEALLAGNTVCLTEITDWIGGQISSQGTSALDERKTQRALLYYPRGYLVLRQAIEEKYGRLNPGGCWVSVSCFMPYDGHNVLWQMLQDAAKQGKGNLKWFPNTVIKELDISNNQIQRAIAIQHSPAPGAPPVNTEPLSATIEDSYRYEDSARFKKNIIQFQPQPRNNATGGADWYVIEATETGEIIALADVPYRVGIDPRNYVDPSSPSLTGDPYCTQGFTYTFAMEATEEPQSHVKPDYYETYEPYYSYELPRLANFNLVFSYRQILSMKPDEPRPPDPRQFPIYPGDISMQNWTWGNDYRPGSAVDNLVYTREQLQELGQLEPGGWLGGLRADTLRRGEENALGYFYWLVAGETDSQLGDGVKKPYPNHRLLTGFDSPMGTVSGLSKYPYMREVRRIVGRPGKTRRSGFTIDEIDMARKNFRDDFYQENLEPNQYKNLWGFIGALQFPDANGEFGEVKARTRATMYPDTVGIGHYAIDFHPCMQYSPAESPGNRERDGVRQGQGGAYPFQIPLRSLIPQNIDNLLVAGKSIAVSYIAAAAYRVHSFEWSAGAAAGTTASFALQRGILPFQLVDEIPSKEPLLIELQQQLVNNGNQIMFPDTSIFNSFSSWD